MTRLEEISRAAANNEPCPDNLSQSEFMLFEGLRYLYKCFRLGAVTREEAVKERKSILDKYRDGEALERLWRCHSRRYQRVLRLEPQINHGECEMCKRILGILDGTVNE